MRAALLKPSSHPCGYIPTLLETDQALLVFECSSDERDRLLAAGYRSFGKYTFRPDCQGCHRCVPLRVPLAAFRPVKKQRKVLRLCEEVEVNVAPPRYTPEKYALYCDHLRRFGTSPMLEEHFVSSFYDPDVPTLEFCYTHGSNLIAVGIVHEAEQALSSVYFTYRLDCSRLSLGTFSVMQEIFYGLKKGKEYLYLGYYIRDNHFMSYKASFYPNEILTGAGNWVPFLNEKGDNVLGDTDPRYPPLPILNV